jgi:ATP-dependent Lon protease
MNTIGLFPLNVVVFPQSSIPLHIFEPRYRELVNVSVEHGKPFGVNLVDSQRLYQTGCTVHVTEVTQKYPDGRMDIVITGRDRYTLNALREGEAPYYVGVVDYFGDDDDDDGGAALRQECVLLYNEIIEIAFSAAADEYLASDLPPDPLSFFIAQKAGLDILRKQELLEMRSERRRLQILQEYMETLLPDLREKRRLKEVVMSDGYLPRRDA